MYIKSKENNLTNHLLLFDHFPKSFNTFNIFFISDIHRRKITHKLLDKIPSTVDLVIIGGDLAEARVPFDRVEHNLKLLKQLAPIYFVYGNNDYEMEKDKLESLFFRYNVTILNNSTTSLASNSEEKLIFLGVEDMSEERDRLDVALTQIQKSGFKILISHNPEIYHQVKKSDNISLILSGHTHGGQIRLFGLGLYEKGKIHYLENSILLISNGYGTSGIPLRLGAPAEAHFIQLKQSDKK